jgi:hypothetical protein
MIINIMEKKLGPISVVLYCFMFPVFAKLSKGGGEQIIATCC